MTDRTWNDSVAIRVAALCLDGKGRLSARPLCSTAVRAGLLVDLALLGRLQERYDSILLDNTPTGFAPADGFLASVTAEPGRSLDDWLEQDRPSLDDMANEAVRVGRWSSRHGLHLKPRYTDSWTARTAADRDGHDGHDGHDVETSSARSLADVAVTAIALCTGLLPAAPGGNGDWAAAEPPSRELLEAAGEIRWLVEATTAHLFWARQRDAVRSRLAQSLGPSGTGPI
jgi:hypothetical protein